MPRWRTFRPEGAEVAERRSLARGAGKQAFLTDPSGNLIELNQPD